MILGLVPLRLRLLVFPPALLYHFATIFTVSYFFHSALLSPNFASYSAPFSLFNLIFHVSYPFPCQSPLPWRYVGLENGEGKTCDTVFMWKQPPTRTLQTLIVLGQKCLYNCHSSSTNKATTQTWTHTDTPRQQVKKKHDYQDYVLM